MPTLEEKATSEMQKKVEELKQRRTRVMLGGGPDKIDKQHKAGKLTARERIEELVDADSFEEDRPVRTTSLHYFGMADKEMPADGVVTGAGQLPGGSFTSPARTSPSRAARPAKCTPSKWPRP